MKVYKSDWIVAISVLAVLFGGKLADGISLGGGSSTLTISEPSAELQTIVKPIAAMVTGEHAVVDRAELSAFCLALVEFHDRDKAAIVNTTALLADHNGTALQAFYKDTGMTGRYVGLGTSIDKALAGCVGIPIENGKFKAIEFTPAMAVKAAEFYRALAWVFQQES